MSTIVIIGNAITLVGVNANIKPNKRYNILISILLLYHYLQLSVLHMKQMIKIRIRKI